MINKYGYVRVSTKDQNEDRQLEAMKQLEILEKNIYVEKISGKDFNRPVYQKLVKKLRADDLLYIKRKLILLFWICRYWIQEEAKILWGHF